MKQAKGVIMVKTLLSALFFTLSLSIIILWMTPLQAVSFSVTPDYSSCVKVFDGGMQGNGQKLIRFYNGCPERLYINACVKSREGEIKLYQSGRSIMTNGNFTLYTFPFVTPSTIQWSAGRTSAAIPPICA